MPVTLPTFTPLEDSLFLMLYARALDNRRSDPILGDATADQIVMEPARQPLPQRRDRLQQLHPKLQLVREILRSREPEIAEFPPVWRRYHRLAAYSTAWSRTGTIVLHHRF